MWKRPEDKPQSGSPSTQPATTAAPANSGAAPRENRPPDAPKPEAFRHDVAAHIGKSVLVKGQLSGSEDLYLDGEVEGSIELKQHSVTIGPNGRVKARVSAKSVVIEGKVDGNLSGSERVEIRGSAVVNGDIVTKRIVIAEGASFRGSVTQEGGAPTS